MMITLLVVGLVLIGIGTLIGSSWTVQALEAKFRQQTAERRRLNEEWRAVRAYRARQRHCAACDDQLGSHRQPALVTGAHDDFDD